MKRRPELSVPKERIINLTPNPISCYSNTGEIITIPPGKVSGEPDCYYILGPGWSGVLEPEAPLLYVANTGIGRGGVKVSVLKLSLWPDIRVYPT